MIGILLISTITVGLSSSHVFAAPDEQCMNSNFARVEASAADTNFPASAAIDANPQTLWSNYGKGAWITLDLGQVLRIFNVDVSWYKGDQ